MKLFFQFFSVILLFPFVWATPDSKALENKAAKFDALFQQYNRPDVPGASVIVIRNGKLLFKKAYGSAIPEERIPTTTSTNYRIASVTKQFTAMAIMILAERKRLSYDNHLTDFFPDLPEYGKQITVRHLLNHTSGLIEYGEVIPNGTTKPLTDRDVFYRREDHSDRHRAYGYTQRGDTFIRTDQSLTSSILGDGSIYSSVDDLYKWDQALYTTRLISSETLKLAFTPGASVDEGTSYGFGWFIENKRSLRLVWHGGNTIGFTAAIQRFPDQRFTVIILTNRNSAQLSEIVDKIEELYLFNPK